MRDARDGTSTPRKKTLVKAGDLGDAKAGRSYHAEI